MRLDLDEDGNPLVKLKRGGINLTPDELHVLEKLVKAQGIDWFSYVKRSYGNRGNHHKKEGEHFYPFDSVIDTVTGKRMAITEALRRIEDEIKDVGCLDPKETRVYGILLDRAKIKSRFVPPQYKGIFKNAGLSRRIIRWFAMDELAVSLVNEKARTLWEEEGFPPNDGNWGMNIKTRMELFRHSKTHEMLTEDEFDRISEVFRKCINMK